MDYAIPRIVNAPTTASVAVNQFDKLVRNRLHQFPPRRLFGPTVTPACSQAVSIRSSARAMIAERYFRKVLDNARSGRVDLFLPCQAGT